MPIVDTSNAERPSSEGYAVAFRGLSSSQRTMLVAHYFAPGRTVTTHELAARIGWYDPWKAKRDYNELARIVNNITGFEPSGIDLEGLVSFELREAEWHWTMHPEVAEALETLGWTAASDASGFPGRRRQERARARAQARVRGPVREFAGTESKVASIIVGADGVVVRERFYHHSRISDVRRELLLDSSAEAREVVESVSLHLSGDEVVLLVRGCSRSAAFDILDTIKEARAAWTLQEDSVALEGDEIVARGERTGSEWLHALRRFGAVAPGAYRSNAMSIDALSHLLDDIGAMPSDRAAAAVALTAAGDATAAARLRFVASSMANPRTRMAMMRIAEARDDAVVAEALEALDGIDREGRL